MALAKVVMQITCPNCRMVSPHGSPYCDRCGTSLSNVLALAVQPETTQAGELVAHDPEIKRFLSEEQDPVLVKHIYDKASQIMTHGEEIEYIATANKSVIGLVPDCVVATNSRLIAYKKKILGKVVLDDCFWRDVRDAQMRDTRHGVSLVMETIQGWRLTVESLPRAQAWRLYEIGATHNAKLRAKLDQLLAELQAQEETFAASMQAQAAALAAAEAAALASEETPIHELSVASLAYESGTKQPEFPIASSTPQPEPEPELQRSVAVEPLTIPISIPSARPQSSSPSTGPLPVIMPPSAEPLPAQEWQLQAALDVEHLSTVSPSAAPAPSILSGLDDLFAPSLQKDAPAASPQEERPLDAPIPMAQLEPALFAQHTTEQLAYGSSAPALLPSYQIGVEYSPQAGGSNGSNGFNGSHGSKTNGALHLSKNGTGIVTEELVPVEPLLATPKVTPRELPTIRQLKDMEIPAPSSLPHVSNTPSGSDLANVDRGEPKRTSSPSESPMRKLRQLKRMLDVGLITQDDYETKKADILSRI